LTIPQIFKYPIIHLEVMPRQPSSKRVQLEIDASQVKEKIDRGEDVYILDVRTPEEYDAWRMSYDKHQTPPLIPVDQLFSSQEALKKIPKDKEVITVCAHGNRSMMAARLLSQMGYDVKSMAGGMAGWNRIYDIAVIAEKSSVKIWQIRRVSKGCVGYLIESGKDAIVIDSTCDIDQSFIKITKEKRLAITNVIDTHMHADHVSGLSRLAKETGAQAYISSYEGYEIEDGDALAASCKQLKDGDMIVIADGVFLKAIHTPGHTEGSMSFILKAGDKTFLFSGDMIFVDGIGRPDLRDRAAEFANSLYDTYQQKLLTLPDDTVILPAHISGSTTLRHGEPVYDTLGSIKKNVKLLSLRRDEFVKFVTDTAPPKPANYREIIEINKALAPCDELDMGDLEAGPNSCAIHM
jgi:glyoxylase-like metal-dependent hydrolase (beta-lactamase superfamily II)/rhodanese-related sulfurtransferase